jgi:hypothetical protein
MSSGTEAERRLAVVIVVDGLRASALGTYGNTSFPTPLFDELASRSLVLEWLLSTGPTIGDFYRGAVSGVEAAAASRRLLSDDVAIVDLISGSFDEAVALAPSSAHRAKTSEATHAAAFFSHAVEHLAVWQKETADQGRHGLLWIHFSGLMGSWDAPLAMREEMLDEDDPPAPVFVTPPRGLRGVDDPDELLGYRVAYAAQVSVIESCLAGFVQAWDDLPFSGKKLALVVGGQGFSLGEHGCVGHDCQSLYSEQLHLPGMILADQTCGPLPRVTGFAQPADIRATISHWISGESRLDLQGRSLVPFLDSRPGQLRDVVIAGNTADEWAIRTSAWLMKQGASTEVFAKPDDRWEANDVATRCPDVVEQLAKHLESLRSGRAQPLTDDLTSHWR